MSPQHLYFNEMLDLLFSPAHTAYGLHFLQLQFVMICYTGLNAVKHIDDI